MLNPEKSFLNYSRMFSTIASLLLLISFQNMAMAIMSDFYQEPGINPFRSYNELNDYEKIDPFTGKLQLHHSDIVIPGNGGMNLEVRRSYTSGSITGKGWNSHYGYVQMSVSGCTYWASGSNSNDPTLVLPDGGQQVLTVATTGADITSNYFITSQLWRATCATTSPGLIVTSPDGKVYEMLYQAYGTVGDNNVYFYATKITDRNGNSISITYDNPNGNGVIVTGVSSSDGRSLTYTNSALDSTGVRVLTSITDGSRTWNYSYVAGPSVGTYLLSRVTRPDGTTWEYTYNGEMGLNIAGSYQIKTVKNPRGGISSYTYIYKDLNALYGYVGGTQLEHFIDKKIVSGIGTWTYSYTPSIAAGVYDSTTVTAPDGTPTIYKHFGYQTVANGTVWKIGLLAEKTIGTKIETYVWTPLVLSNQNNARGYAWAIKFDNEFNAPLLSTKTVALDGTNYVTNFSGFDIYGNPSSISESGPNGGSRITTLTYYINTAKWIVKQAQNESYSGSAITRAFDPNGNLTSISKDGVSTSYTYDAQGNIASATFPRSLTHYYSSYYRGIPQIESQPEGITITRGVSSAGNVTSERDGEGRTKTFSYDALNRVTGITYPAGSPVSISYGITSKNASRGGLVESTIYDGFGRPTSITLGGIARTFTYDALNRKTFESNPGSGSGTNYQYDALGRVRVQTNADSTTHNFSYSAGSMTDTDERAKATTFTFRSYGDPDQRLLMTISAPEASANVSLARNTKGLITSATQGGFTRTYGYNGNYYLTSVTNPETGTTSYGRDAAGNMTSRSIGTSGVTNYSYDGQNRLTNTTYPGSTPAVNQTYSRTHKLITATSTAVSRSFSYDANDNLSSEALTVDGILFTTGYAYNGNDQLSSITYPRLNRVVNYAPDVLGRPTQVSGYVTAVSYWPSGQINQITYSNGTISSYAQNARLWPSNFVTKNGTTSYFSSSYTYDGVGNLTGISDLVDASYNRTVGYDNINRLTSIAGAISGSISYNGVGNITNQVTETNSRAYTYDAQNRLSSLLIGTNTNLYSYDAYGNIATGAGNTYTYDGVPNLRCVNCATGGEIAYVYDGLNQRASIAKAGVKTYEVYGSHGNLLEEFTPGQPSKLLEYIYLGGKRIAQRLSYQ